MLPAIPSVPYRPSICFNPHRPAKAGAAWRQANPGEWYRFQSSPAREGRCCHGGRPTQGSGTGFNPHRPAKAGAAVHLGLRYGAAQVSILTGPRRPVLHANERQHQVTADDVSILTGPRRPVLRPRRTVSACVSVVSILTGPRRPVLLCVDRGCVLRYPVSILTGPRRPVLRPVRICVVVFEHVSILTGPRRPVLLRDVQRQGLRRHGFNPHRPAKAGAATPGPVHHGQHLLVSILTGPRRPVLRPPLIPLRSDPSCFNPHRPAKAGAAIITRHPRAIPHVSILTGPRRPVLQCEPTCGAATRLVSILTGPRRPVLLGRPPGPGLRPHSFNPHRPAKAGAASSGVITCP